MQTTYIESGVSLTYANGGLDRFGRVVNHSWMNGNNPLIHILHGYDYAGNRLYRNDVLSPDISELYTYDQLDQVKSLSRGTLNQNQSAVSMPSFTEQWNFDKTGNWVQYDKNGIVETRTHNTANEIQAIATYDKNGNMTVMPGLKAKYDAWNRLVEVRNSSDNLIAKYEYNGANQRIKKIVGNTTTLSFFNARWQELESVTNEQVTTYVWGKRYIDDLIYRQRGEEKLYSLADSNWNVVATTDAIGAVQERMKYDAFGKIMWMDANFLSKADSDNAWNRTFTGQTLDVKTGLMLYRMRYHHTGLGRFINRDPIRYRAGDANLYRYVFNKPNINLDPLGLQFMPPLTPEVFGVQTTQGGLQYCYAIQSPQVIAIQNEVDAIVTQTLNDAVDNAIDTASYFCYTYAVYLGEEIDIIVVLVCEDPFTQSVIVTVGGTILIVTAQQYGLIGPTFATGLTVLNELLSQSICPTQLNPPMPGGNSTTQPLGSNTCLGNDSNDDDVYDHYYCDPGYCNGAYYLSVPKGSANPNPSECTLQY